MKFLWGLLFGIGIGFAAGLIFAPQSGEATRAQLAEQGIMLRDRSGDSNGDLMSRAASITEELRARANEALVQGRERYTRTKNELSSRVRNGTM